MKADSYVYFIKPVLMDGPIKVGCSEIPTSRLENLAAWSPWPLMIIGTVPGTIKDEQYLHRCFAKWHSHREWFHSTPELRKIIDEILTAGKLDTFFETLKPVGSIRKRRDHITPERSSYLSYSARIRLAGDRLRKLGEDSAWHTPDYIDQILGRWYRGFKANTAHLPEAADMARLNEFLADPATHSVVPSWRRPKEAA